MTIKLSNIDVVEKFYNIVSEYDVQCIIKQGRLEADAKSIMGIFSLNLLDDIELEFSFGDAKEITKLLNDIQKLKIIK